LKFSVQIALDRTSQPIAIDYGETVNDVSTPEMVLGEALLGVQTLYSNILVTLDP